MGRNILLTMEFDGTDFHGWQVQPGQRTVQGCLEDVLRQMTQQPELRAMGSGRTDAGVHAYGMCASFLCEPDIPMRGLVLGLNSQLPDDVRILDAREVPMAFCARRWSKGKRYQYRIWNQPLSSALQRHRAWSVREPLDLEAMSEGAKALLGRHDFSSFRARGCASKHAMRDIFDISIFREGPHVVVEVAGSAFLRHMVRNIVGSLVEVGMGRQTPHWIQEILEARDRRQAGDTAPAHGLYLLAVFYDLPPVAVPAIASR